MDRRFLLAMVLFMVIILGPGLLIDRPEPAPIPAADSLEISPPAPAPSSGEAAPAPTSPATGLVSDSTIEQAQPQPEDTVLVESELYRYGVSTRGGRFISAVLTRYNYTIEGRKAEPVELLRPGSQLLGLRMLVGRDTVSLDDWDFEPSSRRLSVGDQAVELTLVSARGGLTVELGYRFLPGTYQVEVVGTVTGLGPNGATLLIGLGPGIANTEANESDNQRSMGFVIKSEDTDFTRFGGLDPGEIVTEPGPFEWVAVKSKYFAAGVLSFDEGHVPLAGLTARAALSGDDDPDAASVWASRPVTTDGAFGYRLYLGPMEYPRLKAIGHSFDDINPYGFVGIRTVIRPLAVAGRWVLVELHDLIGLHYGLVLIIFGIMVRVLLWPLNQKAMRSSIRMQAVQPLMKELQAKHKEDPQRLQQEMFKLYKEHDVNPFGGCWPMLLPMPILFALFFVFQNTIELRGVPFLWLPDLAQADPLYIIPLLMGASMFAVSKVGQIGMEPNPQMKMMLYVMPVMMTVLFANFASGLNLYYAVQNIVSVPQQWYLAHERLKSKPPPKPTAESGGSAADKEGPPRPKQLKRKKRK